MESIAAAPVGKTVADHGEGVPHDFVPHLFERFTRATTGSAVTQKGTGLGLYIVWQLAHVNRARVTYQDNRPSGARFVLHLAAAPADEQPPGAARRATPAGSR